MPDASPSALPRDGRIVFTPATDIRRRFIEFFAAREHEVVPSASLVPAGDQTLLFTNSGMVQFKDVLTGRETRSYRRAVDAQRCLRVAGKHNDFEEVGRTPRHHTLFEMLGNWSFGDYFKREAIAWAWELLTEEFGIPADRLAATVYTHDDDAYRHWRDDIGLPPERIARWGDVDAGDEKNFWRMAETGPCGPCSEIHFDRGPAFSEGDFCVPDHSETCPRWLEIWNLVFMEFDQLPDGRRVPLPFTSVDTGLGLERLASVLQQVATNYDTDLFTPIHARMRELLGHDPESFEAERFSYQVIADHSRAVTFLIADGVLPSNEGRGYVLRRILRRAVRHGRLLGRREPFMAETADVVIDTMAGAYPHLRAARDGILEAIRREEAQFARTLDAGMGQLEAALVEVVAVASPGVASPGDAGATAPVPRGAATRPGPSGGAATTILPRREVGRLAESLAPAAPLLDGAVAFRLHDTYGFPIDLTIELAAEYGMRVDRAGYEEALAEQRARSRAGAKGELSRLALQASLYEGILRASGDTTFLGYETTMADGRVVAIVRDGIEYAELSGSGAAEVVLDRTPFYAEGGGQVGDRGGLHTPGNGDAPVFRVDDTRKPVGGLIVHRGRLDGALRIGDALHAVVDAGRRERTMRNHTATHLLHRALRNSVGNQARQAGSLVTPEYLRFDFPLDRPVSDAERTAIEAEVRAIIRDDRPVTWELLPMAEAIARGADAFFDEKYGETVRTVSVRDYSRELCGGTHCRATGQIGGFVITAERSIGSGMRRIEALTGDGADVHVAERLARLDDVVTALGAADAAAAPARIAELQGRVRELERRLREGGGRGVPRPRELVERAESIDGTRLVAAAAPFETPEDLKSCARDVRGILPSGVIALALDADDPQLFVTVSDDLVGRGVSAASLVQAAATRMDGRGGGRPEMAQARGSRRDGIAAALEEVRRGLAAALGTPLDGGA